MSFQSIKKEVGRAFAICALTVLGILGTVHTSHAYTPHTQGEAVNWANSQLGKSLDYDNYAGAQCVDLIKYYYNYFGVANYAMGNANAYMTNSLPAGWTRVYGNYQAGDIAVWKVNHSCRTCNTSNLGHVGIITSADSVGFNAVNQNFAGQSYCTQNWFYCSALNCAIRPAYGSADNVKPTICNMRVTDITKDGYTVTCDVSDNVGVTKVLFPSWNVNKHIGDDAVWLQGTVTGGTASCRINISALKSGAVEGDYMTHVYAYDAAGNSTAMSSGGAFIDRTAPKFSEARILSQDSQGYYVECQVSDSHGIQRVQCPTWTLYKDQDDLDKNWGDSQTSRAYKAGTDTYRFRVNRTAHNNESGLYVTHIYAYDNCGNSSCYALSAIDIKDSMQPQKISFYDGALLAIYDESMTWSAMNAFATKQKGHLVTINSDKKQEAVNKLMKERPRAYYYMGCFQSGKGAPWQWMSGEEFAYTNWDITQPDFKNEKEFYGSVIASTGKWNDLSDGYGDAGFIIEIPLHLDKLAEIKEFIANFQKETGTEVDLDDELAKEEEDNDIEEEETPLEIGKARIKSVKNLKKKKLKVTVRSVQDADYYQFRIATNKILSKNKKTLSTGQRMVTFKKLKKKTYYVRVRGYAYENGKKVFGDWSAVKKIKIKK